MSIEKILSRVKKLLQMTRSDNEHEAAQAAAKAAALIEEYQLSEALLRLDDDTVKPEAIIDRGSVEGEQDDPTWKRTHKRVAWKGTIAGAVADSLGGKMWWDANNQIRCYGRESVIQAWSYTCRYLFNEVSRLCENAWDAEGVLAEQAGQRPRAWKNAFRVGAALTIARRLYDEVDVKRNARKQVKDKALTESANVDSTRSNQALMIVEHDEAEVEKEYAAFGKRENFRSTPAIGWTSSRSGLDAGREAGERIAINRTRGGLPAGQGRIGKES